MSACVKIPLQPFSLSRAPWHVQSLDMLPERRGSHIRTPISIMYTTIVRQTLHILCAVSNMSSTETGSSGLALHTLCDWPSGYLVTLEE